MIFISMILVFINLALISLFLFWILLLIFQKKLPKSDFNPGVSVIVAVYNEKDHLPRFLESLKKSDYSGELEVIVVDDGSTDGSTNGIDSVKVIRTKHMGKCHALNIGLKAAKNEVLLVADADLVVSPGAIRKVVAPMEDEKVGLVSGKMELLEKKGIMSRFQCVEYAMTSALLHAHTSFGISLPFVYGAFTAVRKSALEEIGGFQCGTLIEDSDTHVTLLEKGYKVVGSEAVVATDPAVGLKAVFLQRLRWMRGGIELFSKHWRSLFRGGSLTYMLLMFLAWPVGTFVSLVLNIPEFLKWWTWDPNFFVLYIINWVTFTGPWLGISQWPSWGFPFVPLTGLLVGITSSLAVLASQVRQNRDFGVGEFFAMVCFPLYAWIFMAVVGLMAITGFVAGLFKK